MNVQHTKEGILDILRHTPVAAVATSAGRTVRNRMMHYAFDKDLNCYLASMKGDPKTVQITQHPSIALLVYDPGPETGASREVEIGGKATIVTDEDREKGLQLCAQRSPVVAHLMKAGNEGLLDCIKVTPQVAKLRVFREIVQGKPPTVLEFPENRVVESDWALLRAKLSSWRIALRLPFLTASLVPVLLGTVMAWASTEAIHWASAVLTLMAALLLHAAVNVLNDYFDHLSGADQVNVEYVRPFSGGSRVIQLGLLTPLEVLSGGLLMTAVACIIGLYLTWARGPVVLVLGAIGLFSGLLYTTPPVNWAARGIGEILVGLNFGVLMTLGAYYVQARALSWAPLAASLPVALLIAAVLWINEFPDYRADRAAGKKTLVVRLGRQRSVVLYTALVVCAHLVLALGVASAALPAAALFGLVTLPLSLRAAHYARRYHASSFDLVPANALTVATHLATGLLLALAYAWEALGSQASANVVLLVLAAVVFVLYAYRQIERQKDSFLSARQAVR